MSKINKILISIPLVLVFNLTSVFGGGACSPASVNSSCLVSTNLIVNDPCINGTTCGGTPELMSSCLYSGSECSWYSFTASSSDMFVSIEVTTFSGCHISSNIYESTGLCAGNEISCLSGSPLNDLHSLTGLTIGTIYYIQVCYSPGGPCGNSGSAEYCISVGIPDLPCDLCIISCGTASGFIINPTVQQVMDNCLTSPFVPELQPNSNNTFCYDFQAINTTVDFGVIITSNCSSGNVVNLSWELYNSTCGTPLQTGDLSSLTFNSLIIGDQYVFCYTFDVPSTCTHSQHCPYFVGAAPILLSSNILSFSANRINNIVEIKCIVKNNNDINKYEIERSVDGINFDPIIIKDSIQENSNEFINIDDRPLNTTSYYRIKIIRFDGSFYMSMIFSVMFDSVELSTEINIHRIYPVPLVRYLNIDIEVLSIKTLNIKLLNSLGEIVFDYDYRIEPDHINKTIIDMKEFGCGIYFISIQDKITKKTWIEKIIKN